MFRWHNVVTWAEDKLRVSWNFALQNGRKTVYKPINSN
jgi:hypothetical protein